MFKGNTKLKIVKYKNQNFVKLKKYRNQNFKIQKSEFH